MPSKYKRRSKKIGPFTTRTVTYNANGTRTESYSTKSPTGGTRRTYSYNSNGARRTTHSTKLGGGWLYRTQKSTKSRQWKGWRQLRPKKRQSTSSSNRGKQYTFSQYVGLTNEQLLEEWVTIIKWVAKWVVVPLAIIYVLV